MWIVTANEAQSDDDVFEPNIWNQLQVFLDSVLAPRLAIAKIRDAEEPRTIVAIIVYLAVIMVAAVLQQPAADHVTLLAIARKAAEHPAMARAILQSYSATPLFVALLSSALGGFVSVTLSALYYFAVAALCGREPEFRKAWALAANSSAIVAITALVNSAIVCFRGVDVARMPVDLFAVPGLGDFFANPTIAIALSVYNVINVFYYIEAAAGLEMIFGVPRKPAIGAMVFLSLLTSGFYCITALAFARLL
jgi:hypothetical protein